MSVHPEDSCRQAVALSYREGESAQQFLAKDYGEMAERIPPALYQIIAELLV